MCVIRGRPAAATISSRLPTRRLRNGHGLHIGETIGELSSFAVPVRGRPSRKSMPAPVPDPVRDHFGAALRRPHKFAPSAPGPVRSRYMQFPPGFAPLYLRNVVAAV